ncbi:hypothetical protein [Thermobrachium celere]|uniref:hypothetical protein n=1 Tax=Thermobrachium celere TaxID=53422 RepID=UPI001943F3D6|nr:hypothetical protein [Thermobrachium celere]GFR34565.1 hypothetical protein TCEA9_03770 [Thermobrachium celere]
MGIAILFRNQQKPNWFRECIFEIIKCNKIDGIVLSYPFYYENKPYIDGSNTKKKCEIFNII